MVFEPSDAPIRGLPSVLRAFGGNIDGLTGETIAEALRQIQAHGIGLVFLDGSNLGELARAIKATAPAVRVCTFFHNVEARFFFGALLHFKSVRAVGVLLANYLAERKAVRYSDTLIVLTERDSRGLQRLYGRAATHVAPIALRDRTDSTSLGEDGRRREPYILFVGGVFYANRSGIAWFVKNVVPRISVKTCIVGKGFENLKRELERTGKVEVVGEISDLEPWYRNSRFVIAPIFDGSGMKTKVAEALMFGKRVVGTPDAFAGYEEIVGQAGRLCSSPAEFADAIGAENAACTARFDAGIRVLYEEKYSYAAYRDRLERTLI
jgi:glycosyltransferase involved in cell wall biosynthesis